jgi:hypothetical protein
MTATVKRYNFPVIESDREAGDRHIRIIFRDKCNGSEIETLVKRAQLAKYYNQYQVMGSKNGLFVVEI